MLFKATFSIQVTSSDIVPSTLSQSEELSTSDSTLPTHSIVFSNSKCTITSGKKCFPSNRKEASITSKTNPFRPVRDSFSIPCSNEETLEDEFIFLTRKKLTGFQYSEYMISNKNSQYYFEEVDDALQTFTAWLWLIVTQSNNQQK